MRFLSSTIFLVAVITVGKAQIETSEISVKHMGDVTSIMGKVGIGTLTPEYPLDVAGWVKSQYLLIKPTSPVEGGELSLEGSTGYNSWFLDNHAGRYRLHHSGATFFQVNPNGNVGIGTTTPGEKLDVEGRIKAATFLSRRPNEQVGWGLKIEQRSDLAGFITLAGRNLTIDFGWDKALTLGSSHHAQYSGKVLIPGANVGIGTSSPTEKLHVNGRIRATGQVGWSDFVFYDDYQLPTLAEVEQHIEEKGHLKDIPSEEEVLEHGIDLTEMDSKLLQKIEELTLYLIEQNKKIEHLENEIVRLKSE